MTTTVTNRQTGTHFVARTPETFGYDSDGNLTNDGRFAYAWDAENRLIAAEELTSPSGRGRVRVEHRYDSQSRRFRKLVYTRSADLWSLTSDLFFLYDGWNLIREERRPDAKNRTMNYAYTWGLDLSGTPQGAGGIGGLLAASYGNTSVVASVFYTFDGNGNVSDLIADNGTLAAHYEYDPFGNTLVATGGMARENTFRFSTKYTEEETGLVYYGYRYYQVSAGRWINRDPIGELGGRNLYGCVGNASISRFDKYGLVYQWWNPFSWGCNAEQQRLSAAFSAEIAADYVYSRANGVVTVKRESYLYARQWLNVSTPNGLPTVTPVMFDSAETDLRNAENQRQQAWQTRMAAYDSWLRAQGDLHRCRNCVRSGWYCKFGSSAVAVGLDVVGYGGAVVPGAGLLLSFVAYEGALINGMVKVQVCGEADDLNQAAAIGGLGVSLEVAGARRAAGLVNGGGLVVDLIQVTFGVANFVGQRPTEIH